MLSDQERRELYEAAEHALGRGPASTLMELLPPVGWSDVARKSDLDSLRVEVRGEMAGLRGEIAELRGEIKAILPKLIAANIASMIGVSGLVLAAAQLA